MKLRIITGLMATLFLATVTYAIGQSIIFSLEETGASHHAFRWNGKGWDITPPLPKDVGTVSSPLGPFTLQVLRGKDFTVDLPRCRSGYKQIRIHVWQSGRSY